MPQKPAAKQIWNVLGKVAEQDQVSPDMVRIKLSVATPITETDGSTRWSRGFVIFYFDRYIYDRQGRTRGFLLLIRRTQPRVIDVPARETLPTLPRNIILDCVPFESGNRKRVYKLKPGNSVLGEP